jgi:outer membrane receptor for ferrienterochelin and colicin
MQIKWFQTHFNNLIKQVDIQNSRDNTGTNSLDQMLAYGTCMRAMYTVRELSLKINVDERSHISLTKFIYATPIQQQT